MNFASFDFQVKAIKDLFVLDAGVQIFDAEHL
jgi:hypothetical protein